MHFERHICRKKIIKKLCVPTLPKFFRLLLPITQWFLLPALTPQAFDLE